MDRFRRHDRQCSLTLSGLVDKPEQKVEGVRFRGVSKRYDRETVLHDIDIAIAEGEMAVFVGPSGCGKSTLLRLLAGLETVTAGEIRIRGRLVNDDPPRERDIAMVFQSYALYPHMTVGQNIAFPLRMSGATPQEQRAKVEQTASLLGLSDTLDRYPRQLSGGQRQRVAMGRAIVRDPAIFLFDEPLSNLDAALRVQMRAEIIALHRQMQATMIYVTHDQVEAMTLADRIIVLRNGRVEQIGTPHDIYNAPKSRFVAEFIGSPMINMLPAVAENTDAHLARVILADLCEFEAPLRLEGDGSPEPVYIGIRPEALVPGAGPAKLEGIVSHSEYLGAVQYLYLDVALRSPGQTRRLVTIAPADKSVQAGETVTVGFDPGRCHFFAEDGSRIPYEAGNTTG